MVPINGKQAKIAPRQTPRLSGDASIRRCVYQTRVHQTRRLSDYSAQRTLGPASSRKVLDAAVTQHPKSNPNVTLRLKLTLRPNPRGQTDYQLAIAGNGPRPPLRPKFENEPKRVSLRVEGHNGQLRSPLTECSYRATFHGRTQTLRSVRVGRTPWADENTLGELFLLAERIGAGWHWNRATCSLALQAKRKRS